MDPKRLSMEQGKEFLKQLGIPQRDIDSMKEKWVVDAAVEVLLRFPLMPGEDPSARCISDKGYQSSVDQLPASQRHEDQEDRKSNNQVLRENDQRPKDMTQMAHHYIHQRPPKPPMTQKLKKLQKGPLGQRNPPPAEENTQVKCKNCGAVGHLASSTRCPMKCWGGALVPQPLDSNNDENLENRGPQDFQTPGSSHKTNSGKEPRQRQEEQGRKAVPRKSPGRAWPKPQSAWHEPEDTGPHLRRPTRPLPVPTNKRPSVLGRVPTGQPLVRTADVRSAYPTGPLSKAPAVRAGEVARRCGGNLPCEGLKGSRRDRPPIPKATASWPELSSHDVPPSARKTPALGPVCRPQTQIKRPRVASQPRPQPTSGAGGQSSEVKVSMQARGARAPQGPVQMCGNPPKKARFSFF